MSIVFRVLKLPLFYCLHTFLFQGLSHVEVTPHMSRCLQEERCQANISRESEQSLRKYIALAENLLHHWCIR
jgi:hypothetical protein